MSNHFPNIWENANSYYGLAFSVITDKGAVRGGQGNAGTFGWGGYFNTQYFADPREDLIGIMMKQTQEARKDETSRWFRQLLLQSIAD